MFAIQYLEDSPDLAQRSPEQVRGRLKEAFERLPIDLVILGWNVPDRLFRAVAEETARHNARLYRWHPLLTGDGVLVPLPEWQTIALNGGCVPGFRGLSEFTFICPNRPDVYQAVMARLDQVIDDSFQGIFLDRMRFPSPAGTLPDKLSCFCEHCRQAAEKAGLDLPDLQRSLQTQIQTPQGARQLTQGLFQPGQVRVLDAFLDFRMRCIHRLIQQVAEYARQRGLEVGLDCFSPCLASMVGQDLQALDPLADWVKVMSYGHAIGPATIPFELSELGYWLGVSGNLDADQALALLRQTCVPPLPASLEALRRDGLSPLALEHEIRTGRRQIAGPMLAGIEMVEMPGICSLRPEQIRQDLVAMKAGGADGLALSWDLWHIPFERLDIVRQVWID